LVRQALRMRPDRIVVGECRGAELADLLAALNTGHDGGAGTLHANTARDVPARLEALGMLGGLPREVLHAQVAAALRVVLHLRRTRDGRVLDEICLLLPGGDDRVVAAVPAWRRGRGLGPAAPTLAGMLADRGVAVPPGPAMDPPVSPRTGGAARPAGRARRAAAWLPWSSRGHRRAAPAGACAGSDMLPRDRPLPGSSGSSGTGSGCASWPAPRPRVAGAPGVAGARWRGSRWR